MAWQTTIGTHQIYLNLNATSTTFLQQIMGG